MDHVVHAQARSELAHQLFRLGQGTSQIQPAIYDSALHLIYGISDTTSQSNIAAWLVERQQPDGGWGDPVRPLTRAIPTLVSVLALADRAPQAARRGVSLLHDINHYYQVWNNSVPEDVPVAAELILSDLHSRATERCIPVPPLPRALLRLGQQRRAALQVHRHRPGTPPLYSWESWGLEPMTSDVDAEGSVGNSPAATLAWIAAASQHRHLHEDVQRARGYLVRAEHATGTNISGLLPNVWPIEWYETVFSLYMLAIAGLLQDEGIRKIAHPFIHTIRRKVADGIGMSEHFTADGDNTATALVVLALWDNLPPDITLLSPFRRTDHFASYHGELQPSVSATAHGIHALQSAGAPCDNSLYQFILDRQINGIWSADKWNACWTYTTSQVLLVLDPTIHTPSIRQSITAICNLQHNNGGWGAAQTNREETAYLVLALRSLKHRAPYLWSETINTSLERAERWMIRSYGNPIYSQPCWLSKELYHPKRLATIIELVATLPDRTSNTIYTYQHQRCVC